MTEFRPPERTFASPEKEIRNVFQFHQLEASNRLRQARCKCDVTFRWTERNWHFQEHLIQEVLKAIKGAA